MSKEEALSLQKLQKEVEQLRMAIEELKVRKLLLADINLNAHIAFNLAIEALSREHASKVSLLNGLLQATKNGSGECMNA